MKSIKLFLQMLLWGCLLSAQFTVGTAQTNTLSTTTLGAALTNSATTLTLASTTNVNVPTLGGNGSYLFIDREMIQVIAFLPPGTTTNQIVQVFRGMNGTASRAHASGAIVWIGNADWFSGAPITTAPAGSCVAGNVYALPAIHVRDGTMYTCDSLSLWGYAGPGIGNPGVRSAVTQVSATYTAKYWDQTIEATANSFVITLPAAAAMPGKVFLLSNTSSGTITVTTAHGCASYTTAGCRVYSNGTVWQAF